MDLAAPSRAAAIAAHRGRDRDAALRHYTAYLSAHPDDAAMWSNLGALQRDRGDLTLAQLAHRRAVALVPDNVGFLGNLANVLSDIGAYDESIALRRQIAEAGADTAEHSAMIGRCLRGMGAYAEAEAHLAQSLRRFPGDAETRLQLAFAELAQGKFADGFARYKVRWQMGELVPRNLAFPEWNGEAIAGKRLLILPEQGLGDAILFARFLPVLATTGATLLLAAPAPLKRLFQRFPDITTIDPGDIGPHTADVWVNLIDLAERHFAQGGTIPAPPAFSVPGEAAARARQIVAQRPAAFRVGVNWSGSVTYKANRFRSFSHRALLPLCRVPGVELFSLYKGPLHAAYLADGTAAHIHDAAGADADLADTAALMQQLDLVITTDTATAHLAGSLGCRVWTLLHWDPFWLWGHSGRTSAWYPGMRLYRQETPLEWSSLIENVAEDLAQISGAPA